MCKRISALLVLAISLMGTQCWAGSCFNGNTEGVVFCTNTFSPTDTTGTYDFSGNGTLIVRFKTVLGTGFMLTVTVNHTIDAIDPNEFPAGTVAVTYSNGKQVQYDFTGNKGGPNGVPVKGTDYLGLIELELGYFLQTGYIVHDPGFGHAPGPNVPTAMIEEDIITHYSSGTLFFDPTMDGCTPGLSSVAALDKPLEANDSFVWVSPTEGQMFTAGQEIEVEFQLFADSTHTGNPLRDKDASLSLSTFDNTGTRVYLSIGKDEGGKNFHFDHQNGVNEREVDTAGLAPGTYYLDVTSDEFSPPTTRTFKIQ